MTRRGSGILLHPTSLPSPYGVGDLGPAAIRFVDFLAECRQHYWQLLPLTPTSTALGNSPYSSESAFAGNPLVISPEVMVQHGWLKSADLRHPTVSFDPHRVDYGQAAEFKNSLFQLAFERAKASLDRHEEFLQFARDEAGWLGDYALFRVLKELHRGDPWPNWPPPLRDRNPQALEAAREQYGDRIRLEQFQQFLFHAQWHELQRHCRERQIRLIGDLPIYLQHDSADVWVNPHHFKLNELKQPTAVAGVPPDYFSATGQLWGNPVYDWPRLAETGYDWWIKRVAHNLSLYDLIRLDHFRGFAAFWEVPAGAATAEHGRWIEAPGAELFEALKQRFPHLPLIAEDLGVITPDVKALMNRFNLPGMKLLLFAFGADLPTHPFAPHNFTPHCVAYTGTHDNNTIRGWIRKEISPEELHRLYSYLGREPDEHTLHWELVRLLMMSVAETVIIPMQDLLGLGEEARMNRPSTANGNWEWRVLPQQMTRRIVARLADMTTIYGRG
ncbi:MAG TPA: 4-alpha-glucanotransferase [Nitrospiria bacterium]|nr:4-alpha-glucanotransferase [Nitrospiria bacterium]